MGWRAKIVFLMVIYFAGFATAIYYLAPAGAKAQTETYYSADYEPTPEKSGFVGGLCDKAFEKASASFSGMDSAEVKEKFNLGLKTLIEMTKTNQATDEM